MDVKLTLKLQKSAVQKAKLYSQLQGKSLSRIVENYFIFLTSDKKTQKKRSSLVSELSGIIPQKKTGNDTEEYVDYLEKKYR